MYWLVKGLQLKKLEAYGFKSFANKIEVDFDKGITAIVGPNGSGKSNITDAIRWGLGEQNFRNLRATKSEDIIFTGSAARRALGVAEVSLHLANEDGLLPLEFAEIVVTRRLFRSGESEFYINKARCRLKDIYELFADTGIGHDGISIISQNKMDEILNSRPEEKRTFLEETAGITKYRQRKKDALRKLEDTDNNLVRLSDIVSELERQLDPLSKAAEKTRQYNTLQTEYKQCCLENMCSRYRVLMSEISCKRTEGAELLAREAEQRALLAGKESQQEQLQKEILAAEEELGIKAEARRALQQKMENCHTKVKVCEEKARQGREERSRLTSQFSALAKEKESYGRETEALRQALQEAETQSLQRAAKVAEENIKARDIAAFLKKLKADKEHDSAALAADRDALTKKQQELLLWEKELSLADSTGKTNAELLSDSAAECASLAAALEAKEQAQNALVQEAEALHRQQEVFLASAKKAEAALQVLLGKKADTEKIRHEAEARLHVLHNMQSNHEGFGRAVKYILQAQAPWHQKICGAVAEILSVPDEYILAIGVALGRSAQYIVTEDDAAARQAIEELKAHKQGRASFLPLANIVLRQRTRQDLQREKGFLGYGDEIVSVAEKFQRAAAFLLGHTVLVDTLDNALALSKKYKAGLRIVTLTGELLTPGGVLAGGSRPQGEGSYFARRTEIGTLENKLQQLENKLTILAQQETDNRQLQAETARKTKELDEAMQALQVQEATQKISVLNLQENLAAKKRAKAELEQKNTKMTATFAQKQEQYIRLKQDVEQAAASLTVQSSKLDNLKEDILDQEQDADDLRKYINECELQKVVAEQQVLRSKEHLMLQEKAVGRLQVTLADVTERQKSIGQQLAEMQIAMQALLAEKETNDALYQKLMEEEKQCYQQKMAKLSFSQQLEKEKKSIAQSLAGLQDKLHQQELRFSKLEFRRQEIKDSIYTDYGLGMEEAEAAVQGWPEEESAAKGKELSARIADLGQVNPQAITEYEAVAERHGFIKTQAVDLIKAKDDLQRILQEIDADMIKRFRTAFSQVNKFFGDIFVQLFGGGRAELTLTDKDDILASGVEIDVQLPEKRKQNMTALSGGERALTVIALLFACLCYRPAPFCVLDEIDAPLDEANIERFGAFLQSYKDKTQFVIVTHRKGTMAAADAMYGVTSEEAGVSKLVSVHLVDGAADKEE